MTIIGIPARGSTVLTFRREKLETPAKVSRVAKVRRCGKLGDASSGENAGGVVVADTKNGKAPLASARKAHPTTGITALSATLATGVVRSYQIDVAASSVQFCRYRAELDTARKPRVRGIPESLNSTEIARIVLGCFLPTTRAETFEETKVSIMS